MDWFANYCDVYILYLVFTLSTGTSQANKLTIIRCVVYAKHCLKNMILKLSSQSTCHFIID